MTRIDHERNGRPAPADEDDAPDAERPIERVRPVRVPGAVAGGRQPDPPAAANGGTRINRRWQSVRLRLGDGETAQRNASGGRAAPPEGESSALRRYRLPLGLVVAGMATAAVVAALVAGDDGTVPPRPLDRTPPALNAAGLVPLTADAGTGRGTAAALLTGSGGNLRLTVHANVPGRSYLVGLVGPQAVKGLMGAHSGDAQRTVSVNWRDLARYDRLAIYAGTPVAGAAGAKHSGAKHSGQHHSTGGPKGAGGKHAGATHSGAKHSARHHSTGAGGKHAPGRHAGTATRPAKAHRAATPHRTPILSISVDQLVRASGVHVAG